MAKHNRPRVPGSSENTPRKFSIKHVFTTPRQIFYFAFFILWLCIDIALCGLVSQQIHAHGSQMQDWPTGQYQHAMGLLLFASIFSAIIGIFHAWLNIPLLMFVLLANGVFFGTGAGIIEQTPFGHGMQCGNPIELIPQQFRSDFHWCSRVTAIEGLAWAMFALSVVGLIFAFADKFSLVSKRSAIYDDPELAHEKIPETQ